MDRERAGTSLYSGLLFGVLGVVAWLSGRPFIFPSLGPSAFVLAFERHGTRKRTYPIVGAHLIGGVAGLVAHEAVASGVAFTATPSGLSLHGLRLAGSGVLSLVLTSWGMIATDLKHPPACATTLIVSLGLLSDPVEVGIIVASTVILVETHANVLSLFHRVVDGASPPTATGEEAESTE